MSSCDCHVTASYFLPLKLQLPEHSEKIHWVSFSNVEKYFYQRQQEACATRVMNFFSEPSDTALSAMGQSEVTKVRGERWDGVG